MDIPLLEKFVFKGVKGKERPLTVVILTTKLGRSLKNAPSTDKIMKICEERGVRCIIIDTEKGSIQKTIKGTFLISSRGGKQQEIYLDRTVVLTRRSAIKNNAAKGFFKKMAPNEKGEKEIHVLNLASLEYEPRKKPRFATLETAKPIEDLPTRLKALSSGTDKAGEFYRLFHYNLFSYISHRIPEITDEYTEMVLKFKDSANVKLLIATGLKENYGSGLLNTLRALTNCKEILLNVFYNPKLLGGLVLEYNSVSIDASILKEFSIFFNEI
jgi:hypothetical protein